MNEALTGFGLQPVCVKGFKDFKQGKSLKQGSLLALYITNSNKKLM